MVIPKIAYSFERAQHVNTGRNWTIFWNLGSKKIDACDENFKESGRVSTVVLQIWNLSKSLRVLSLFQSNWTLNHIYNTWEPETHAVSFWSPLLRGLCIFCLCKSFPSTTAPTLTQWRLMAFRRHEKLHAFYEFRRAVSRQLFNAVSEPNTVSLPQIGLWLRFASSQIA